MVNEERNIRGHGRGRGRGRGGGGNGNTDRLSRHDALKPTASSKSMLSPEEVEKRRQRAERFKTPSKEPMDKWGLASRGDGHTSALKGSPALRVEAWEELQKMLSGADGENDGGDILHKLRALREAVCDTGATIDEVKLAKEVYWASVSYAYERLSKHDAKTAYVSALETLWSKRKVWSLTQEELSRAAVARAEWCACLVQPAWEEALELADWAQRHAPAHGVPRTCDLYATIAALSCNRPHCAEDRCPADCVLLMKQCIEAREETEQSVLRGRERERALKERVLGPTTDNSNTRAPTPSARETAITTASPSDNTNVHTDAAAIDKGA